MLIKLIFNLKYDLAYIQQALKRIIHHLYIVDSNSSDAIICKLLFVYNSITINVNHFEVGFNERFHRLIQTINFEYRRKLIKIKSIIHFNTCGNSSYFFPTQVFFTACLNSSVEMRPSLKEEQISFLY